MSSFFDATPEIILIDKEERKLAITQSQPISGSGITTPFLIFAGLTSSGSATFLRTDSFGNLKVKAE